MATPNIVGVSDIRASTTYLKPSDLNSTAWTALQPDLGKVNRVNFISAANVTNATAVVSVAINSATAGGGTAYRLAYQIAVPPNSTLIIADKTTSLYVTDTQSVTVAVGTASSIELVASYETITGTA
jgi:hypothetical protein